MPKLWNETIEAHCRVDLGSISQEQDVVARWKFFIRAGIDDIRVFPFDADEFSLPMLVASKWQIPNNEPVKTRLSG